MINPILAHALMGDTTAIENIKPNGNNTNNNNIETIKVDVPSPLEEKIPNSTAYTVFSYLPSVVQDAFKPFINEKILTFINDKVQQIPSETLKNGATEEVEKIKAVLENGTDTIHSPGPPEMFNIPDLNKNTDDVKVPFYKAQGTHPENPGEQCIFQCFHPETIAKEFVDRVNNNPNCPDVPTETLTKIADAVQYIGGDKTMCVAAKEQDENTINSIKDVEIIVSPSSPISPSKFFGDSIFGSGFNL